MGPSKAIVQASFWWATDLAHVVGETAVDQEHPYVMVHEALGLAVLVVVKLGPTLMGWPLRHLAGGADHSFLVMEQNTTELMPIFMKDPCPKHHHQGDICSTATSGVQGTAPTCLVDSSVRGMFQ